MKSLVVVLLLLGLFSNSLSVPMSQQVEKAANTEPVEKESPPLGDPLALTTGATPSTYYLIPLSSQQQQQYQYQYQPQQQQQSYCYCPVSSTQPASSPYMYMTYSSTPSRGTNNPYQAQTQGQYMMYSLTPTN